MTDVIPSSIPESFRDKPIIIRTGDRSNFRRCRRMWSWSSGLRGNREVVGVIEPLWFGTGFHFALEDHNGYNKFGSPVKAFEAYMQACYDSGASPDNVEEYHKLAIGMLAYYEQWLSVRDPYKTLWIDGVPQVEVSFQIRLNIQHPYHLDKSWDDEGSPGVWYQVKFDRVVIDEFGMLWIQDYKTAKALNKTYLMDGQASAYCWGGTFAYTQQIQGMIFQQHLKDIPEAPRFLSSKKAFSTDKRQRTTYDLYNAALKKMYGEFELYPKENVEFLNFLVEDTSLDGDKFIRREKVERNPVFIQSEGDRIHMEVQEMLNPSTPMYPDPQENCLYRCGFQVPCLGIDSGYDWEDQLISTTQSRGEEDHSWRPLIKWPQQLQVE